MSITDEEALAVLTILAMNQLVAQGHPCCPDCCYPCDVLKRLSDRPDGPGSLTSILTQAPTDALPDWALGADVRQELHKRWSRTDCHEVG